MQELEFEENKKREEYERKGYLMEEFRFFHLKDEKQIKTEYHYHEFHKVLFLISGKGSYDIEGKRYLLKAGDIVFVNKWSVHRSEFEISPPYERMILYISTEFLEKNSVSGCELTELFSGKYGYILRPDQEYGQHLHGYLEDLEKENTEHKYGKEIVSRSILLRFLIDAKRSFLYGRSKKPALALPKNPQILEIVNYLNEHLAEEINIDSLAKRFYLSRFHMMRKFKEETGTTIYNYLLEQRLFQAKEWIAKGTSATEACFLCGFQSYASFARAYGKMFGMTPTGRKCVKKEKNKIYE